MVHPYRMAGSLSHTWLNVHSDLQQYANGALYLAFDCCVCMFEDASQCMCAVVWLCLHGCICINSKVGKCEALCKMVRSMVLVALPYRQDVPQTCTKSARIAGAAARAFLSSFFYLAVAARLISLTHVWCLAVMPHEVGLNRPEVMRFSLDTAGVGDRPISGPCASVDAHRACHGVARLDNCK